ncbi:P2 family phage major capsid protein [Anaerophilus nitritogenes]|uniref:P2 family phage major capsid protein n=1 Tax=Anaerophilus nitritogenes TaxID=2498136 RepID=UPI00101CB013|nr:P2 family phage major capsid protein [Anaerophilus nitritogenes]
MTITNTEIIKKAGIHTQGNYGASGLLNPAQSEKFIDMIMDSSEFLKKLRYEKKDRISGTISKLGVGSRLLRGKAEGKDTISGNEVIPVIGDVPYQVEKMKLGTFMTEDWLEENIERENFEDHFMGKIASQIQVDLLDLAFNGDEDTSSSDLDYEFLKLNDGYIKQIKKKGHVVDGATINGGKFGKKYFYSLRRAVPKKYRNPKFRWICSDDTYTDLSEYLSERPTALGDIAITKGERIEILGTGFETVPNMPDDVILYAEPENLVIVYTKDIKHRKTTEGKEAVYEDKRFYATHLGADFVITEIDATGILINRGPLA